MEARAATGAKVGVLVRDTGRAGWGNLEHLRPEMRERVKVVPGDVRAARLMRENVAGCDVVFHPSLAMASDSTEPSNLCWKRIRWVRPERRG